MQGCCERKERVHTVTSVRASLALVLVLSMAGSVLAAQAACKGAALFALDADAGDFFGYSVSVDGFTGLVGAPRDDEHLADAGAAYIFEFNGATWVQRQKLTASDAQFFDWFGGGVALDGEWALIGAPFKTFASVNSGVVYAFKRVGGVWVEQQKLVPSDAGSSDWFGFDIAMDGGLAVIGSSRNDAVGMDSGSAFVFRLVGGVWVEEQKLTASGGAGGDEFGGAVAVAGDVVVVGSALADVPFVGAGSAYVFRFDGLGWVEEQRLTADDAAGGDAFGSSVGVDAGRVLVGATMEDKAANNGGAVYVFEETLGPVTWVQSQKLTVPVSGAGDMIGASLSMDGDASLVGGPRVDQFGFNSGRAFLYRELSGAGWQLRRVLESGFPMPGDQFGFSLSLSGDIAMVSSHLDNTFGDDAGAVFVFFVGFDADLDGVSDACDNCVVLFNPGQEDCDGDGLGDVCEIAAGISEDCDGNGIPDECQAEPLPGDDCDGDGVPDVCETDCQPNGVPDDCDVFDGTSLDCNLNGVPDECETDCQPNGFPDSCDLVSGLSADCNGNAVPDECDTSAGGGSVDCNGNMVPDECERDCQPNGVADSCDISSGTSGDCNASGIPDECELTIGTDCNLNGSLDSCDISSMTSGDCNGNGVPDECDVVSKASADCNLDGVPDECETDCDANGFPDDCDIAGGAVDCDLNGVPDVCDIAGGALDCNVNGIPDVCEPDCQPNGIPDDCDLAGGLPDCNGNGLPDACDLTGGLNDCDGNGVPDECDTDCNVNGVPDVCDIAAQTSPDCNANTVPDECDIVNGAADCNSNVVPDECERDCQPNGVPDDCDIAAMVSVDCNVNGAPDECDVASMLSPDCNGNVIPDECEVDCNGNGVPDDCDIASMVVRDCNGNGVPDVCEIQGGASDCNGNGIPDVCETDCQPNGIPDDCDIVNEISVDCDLNGVPDECDIAGGAVDCNGNAIPDRCEPDCQPNGVADACDISVGTSPDCDVNGVPDECDIAGGAVDCNGNGIPDVCETDCDGNGVPDDCDIISGVVFDCNSNGVPDGCDIVGGGADCNANGVPDECEDDCQPNGVPDACDIASGTSADCDGNGVPDMCDISAGAMDCNGNGVPDGCDLASGVSSDCDGDGVLDECLLGPCMRDCDCVLGAVSLAGMADPGVFPSACTDVCHYLYCDMDGQCRTCSRRWGNTCSVYSGNVGTSDILCSVNAFGNYCSCPNADLKNDSDPSGKGPSGVPLTTGDLLAVVDAFGGADPFGCSSDGFVSCDDVGLTPASGCTSSAIGASAASGGLERMFGVQRSWTAGAATSAQFRLVPRRRAVRAGGMLEVDVFVSGVSGLVGYQFGAVAEHLGDERMDPVPETVETEMFRADYVFAGLYGLPAVDRSLGRLGGVVMDAGVTVGDDALAYLGTYRWRVPEGAVGRIEVRPAVEHLGLWTADSGRIVADAGRWVAVVVVAGDVPSSKTPRAGRR